jgi:ABC-type nitrate/sulfonate/bicarbonate transport system permease component
MGRADDRERTDGGTPPGADGVHTANGGRAEAHTTNVGVGDRRAPKRRSGWVQTYLPPILLLAVFLAVWQCATWLWHIEAYLLPSPSRIISAGIQARGLLRDHVQQTLRETLSGLALAVAIDLSALLRRALYPLLVVTQTIPMMALAPLLVIWLGYSIWPKIIVVALVCFFPIVVTTADGLQSADPDMLALLQAMGATRRQIFFKVRAPGALPSVFSGVKIAVTYSVIGAIIGEWVGASKGLGVFMLRASNSFRTDWVFAAIAISSLLSMLLFFAVAAAERLALPWYYSATRAERWEELRDGK